MASQDAAFLPLIDHTSGVWGPGDDFEHALRRKRDVLLAAAHATGQSTVLDLGYGNDLAAGDGPYGAVISAQGLEHIADRRSTRNRYLRVAREFFLRVREVTAPGTWFALHTVTVNRLPRDRDVLRALSTATRELRLGQRCARAEEIAMACATSWEVTEFDTRRPDYLRTVREWSARLATADVRATLGDERHRHYERLVDAVELAFEHDHLSLAQFILRRID
jgi:cyclopropane fatty-acyl-phospholipid synthase-like methyltransferase